MEVLAAIVYSIIAAGIWCSVQIVRLVVGAVGYVFGGNGRSM